MGIMRSMWLFNWTIWSISHWLDCYTFETTFTLFSTDIHTVSRSNQGLAAVISIYDIICIVSKTHQHTSCCIIMDNCGISLSSIRDRTVCTRLVQIRNRYRSDNHWYRWWWEKICWNNDVSINWQLSPNLCDI